jgi:hypothetical protein
MRHTKVRLTTTPLLPHNENVTKTPTTFLFMHERLNTNLIES